VFDNIGKIPAGLTPGKSELRRLAQTSLLSEFSEILNAFHGSGPAEFALPAGVFVAGVFGDDTTCSRDGHSGIAAGALVLPMNWIRFFGLCSREDLSIKIFQITIPC